jgi:dCTP deaminase
MTVQSDRWITQMAREHGMIEPFEGRQVRQGVISYGVSSYGYDMRVAREFRIFTNVLNSIVDPSSSTRSRSSSSRATCASCPPNSFALARSVEYFRIPRDVVTLCVGKIDVRPLRHHHERHALRARVGGLRHAGDLEHHAAPGEIYANEGIAQVLFFRGSEPPEVSYKDKAGKYQGRSA